MRAAGGNSTIHNFLSILFRFVKTGEARVQLRGGILAEHAHDLRFDPGTKTNKIHTCMNTLFLTYKPRTKTKGWASPPVSAHLSPGSGSASVRRILGALRHTQ